MEDIMKQAAGGTELCPITCVMSGKIALWLKD
jgi:hypothetical protein